MTLDQALEASIVAWEKRAAGKYLEVSYEDCPLCQFVKDPTSKYIVCENCPVMQFTGQANCRDTPALNYQDMANCFDEDSLQIPQPDLMAQAALEVAFLKSLRRTK